MVTIIGLVQTLIPAPIRHHYCDPEESFWSNPNFNIPKLTRSLEIYNWILGKSQLWSEGLVGLGRDFGIYVLARAVIGQMPTHRAAVACLVALQTLDEARTRIDMPALIERLHTPIHNLEDAPDPGDDLEVQRMGL